MLWFTSLTLLQQLLIVYLLIINIITFFYFGLDKLRSQINTSARIRESHLLLLVFIGGALGGLAGMKFFRHKTKKISFQSALIIILSIQFLALAYLFDLV